MIGLNTNTISPWINADGRGSDGGKDTSTNRPNACGQALGLDRRAFCCQIEEFTDDCDRPIVAFRSRDSMHSYVRIFRGSERRVRR